MKAGGKLKILIAIIIFSAIILIHELGHFLLAKINGISVTEFSLGMGPRLFSIQKGEPEYYEAKRLLKFLEYFLGIDSENVPNNSICREFIGGSLFNV